MQMDYAPFTYAHACTLQAELQKAYPFAEFTVFGRSVTGRGIFACSVGEGTENILFLAGLQAEDTASPLLLYRFFARLCACYQGDRSLCNVQIRRSLQGRKITVVPCLCPDSFEIHRYGALGAGCYAGLVSRTAGASLSDWHANARGVNVAHNFDYHHQSVLLQDAADRPAPFAYAGHTPESEAETQSLVRLCNRSNFRHSVLLEGFGQHFFWASPDSFSDKADIPLTAKVLAGAGDYTLSAKTDCACRGTFHEWFTSEYGHPAFHIAPGKYETIDTKEQFDEVYHEIEEMLVLSAIL